MIKGGVVNKKRAQASFEYIILFSLFIAILTIVLYYTSTNVNTYIKNNELEDSVKSIANNINQIGAMEKGSEKIVMYKIPKSVKQSYVSYKEINLRTSNKGKLSDTHFTTKVPAFGFIEIGENQHFLVLKKEDNGYVSINPLGEPNLTKDLVAYYDFEIGNSTHTYDASGNNNHGEYNGNVTCTVDGHIGNGCEFDGDGDFIKVIKKDDLSFQNSNSFSFFSWVYLKDINRSIIIGDYDDDVPTISFEIDDRDVTNQNSFRIYLSTGSGETKEYVLRNNYIINNWYFLGFTWNGKELKLYENGDSFSSTKDLDQELSGTFNSGTNFTIGIDSRSNTNEVAFNGTMDNIMIWNRTLTDDEIKKLYTLGYTQ